jgi:hypothetical protein
MVLGVILEPMSAIATVWPSYEALTLYYKVYDATSERFVQTRLRTCLVSIRPKIAYSSEYETINAYPRGFGGHSTVSVRRKTITSSYKVGLLLDLDRKRQHPSGSGQEDEGQAGHKPVAEDPERGFLKPDAAEAGQPGGQHGNGPEVEEIERVQNQANVIG